MSALEHHAAHLPPSDRPWERIPGEKASHFAAFTVYRDLGPDRSIDRVAALTPHDRKTIGAWSSAYGWVERVAAWEAHLDAERLEARVRAIRAMEDRHAELAVAGLAAMAMPLIALARDRVLPDGTRVLRSAELEAMPTADLVNLAGYTARAMARLVSVERVARGEVPPEIPPAVGDGTVEPKDDVGRVVGILNAMQEAGIVVEGNFRVGPSLDEESPPALPVVDV